MSGYKENRSRFLFIFLLCAGFCSADPGEQSDLLERVVSERDSSNAPGDDCQSTQELCEDSSVLLQSGRIKVERLIEEPLEQHSGAALSSIQRSSSSPTKMNSNKLFSERAKRFIETTFHSLTKLESNSINMTTFYEELFDAGGPWMPFFIGIMMCTCVAFAGCFVMQIRDAMRKHHLQSSHQESPSTLMTSSRFPHPVFEPNVPPQEPIASTPQTQANIATGTDVPRTPQEVFRNFLNRSVGLVSFSGPASTSSQDFATSSASSSKQQQDASSSKQQQDVQQLDGKSKCPTRFGVPVMSLPILTQGGKLQITGPSGRVFLLASVGNSAGRRTLSISMAGAPSTPQVTISHKLDEEFRPKLEIRGRQGTLYGLLEMERLQSPCKVTQGSETLMAIDGDIASGQLTVMSGAGQLLASATSTKPSVGVDHVDILVEPGVDTVIVLACILAVFWFALAPN